MQFTLPWPPTGLSPNSRLHWATLAKLKKQYREACAWTAMQQGAEPMPTDVRLHLALMFFPPTRRDYDLDNALARMKSGLDGLADALRVDDRHWRLSIKKGEGIGGFVRVQIEQDTTEQCNP